MVMCKSRRNIQEILKFEIIGNHICVIGTTTSGTQNQPSEYRLNVPQHKLLEIRGN